MREIELIAQQALKIAELEEKVKEYDAANKQINSIIFCIGGPLNDNILGYTHKQMVPFSEIAKLVEF